MQVEQIMNRDVKTCGPHDSLNKAAQMMWDTPCGAVPVVDEQGCPVGFSPTATFAWLRTPRTSR